jgi:hypothetical protein
MATKANRPDFFHTRNCAAFTVSPLVVDYLVVREGQADESASRVSNFADGQEVLAAGQAGSNWWAKGGGISAYCTTPRVGGRFAELADRHRLWRIAMPTATGFLSSFSLGTDYKQTLSGQSTYRPRLANPANPYLALNPFTCARGLVADRRWEHAEFSGKLHRFPSQPGWSHAH